LKFVPRVVKKNAEKVTISQGYRIRRAAIVTPPRIVTPGARSLAIQHEQIVAGQ